MDDATFFQAIERGDLDAVRSALIENPQLIAATANASNAPQRPPGSTGLHLAVNMNRREVANYLIDAGVDVEARTNEGRTALHDSIEFGCVPVTEYLLKNGVFLDVCSAAILGRIDRLRELLDADPALANDRSTGLSPLGWAAFGNQVGTATELLDRDAKMDDHELLCAASVGHTEVGRLLIERGADPNAVSPEAGGNALHAAAAMRYTFDSTQFIRMLFEHGADARSKTTKGDTALQIAEGYLLLEQKRTANPNDDRRKRYDLVIDVLRECGSSGSASK